MKIGGFVRIIAFKRAGTNFPYLHREFITEYVEASLIPSTEGYETLPEEFFLKELAKNEKRHEEHLKYLELLEKSKIQAEKDAETITEEKERALKREFEQFKRWKANQKGK